MRIVGWPFRAVDVGPEGPTYEDVGPEGPTYEDVGPEGPTYEDVGPEGPTYKQPTKAAFRERPGLKVFRA